jgi:HSP20 family protein
MLLVPSPSRRSQSPSYAIQNNQERCGASVQNRGGRRACDPEKPLKGENIMSTALQQNRLGRVLSAGLPEFDNLFNQFFRAEEVAMWRAPASIWEADNMFHIEIDAPGVSKEDVELTFDKGALQVTLERKAPEGERTNWHNERGYGKVSRSVSLPETVDPNTITAELTNGVLHVTITKLPEAQPKKIDVKVS